MEWDEGDAAFQVCMESKEWALPVVLLWKGAPSASAFFFLPEILLSLKTIVVLYGKAP